MYDEDFMMVDDSLENDHGAICQDVTKPNAIDLPLLVQIKSKSETQ